MPSTSLDRDHHEEGKHPLSIPTNLAGLAPTEFDEAVKPIRKYLEQFNEDGELAKLMLVDNVTHHTVNGMYVRELRIPKGSYILSRVHKFPLVNIISRGCVIVIDSNGYNEYTAPMTFISPAGTQRIVIAPEDSVWNTVHKTDETNPDELVDNLTCDNYVEFISYSNQLTHQENNNEFLDSRCDSSKFGGCNNEPEERCETS
jgi:hypothetical protein